MCVDCFQFCICLLVSLDMCYDDPCKFPFGRPQYSIVGTLWKPLVSYTPSCCLRSTLMLAGVLECECVLTVFNFDPGALILAGFLVETCCEIFRLECLIALICCLTPATVSCKTCWQTKFVFNCLIFWMTVYDVGRFSHTGHTQTVSYMTNYIHK